MTDANSGAIKVTKNPVLKGTDHLKIIRQLSDYLIADIKERPQKFKDSELVATKLKELRDFVWPETAIPARSEEEKEAFFNKILEGLNAAQTLSLIEAYAHMGHLYDIGAMVARENFFDDLRDKKTSIPGGVRDFVSSGNAPKSGKEAVDLLNKPVFEVVTTAHPTNTNSLPAMKAMRELAKAVHTHDEENVKNAMDKFIETSLMHQTEKEGKKVDSNLTVRDETSTMLYFFENIFDDMSDIYGRYDRPIAAKYSDYDPLALNLQMRFSSWGSAGDKDGNNNVTSETTLEALAKHTHKILEKYSKALETIPELAGWKAKIDAKKDALLKDGDGLLAQLEKLTDDAVRHRKVLSAQLAAIDERLKEQNDAVSEKLRQESIQKDQAEAEKKANKKQANAAKEEATSKYIADNSEWQKAHDEKFEQLSGQLKTLRDGNSPADALDINAFIRDIEAVAKSNPGTKDAAGQFVASDATMLLRRARTFGFNFGKIEYRETALEYQKVMGLLIEGYTDLTPQQKVEKLNDVFAHPKKYKEAFTKKINEIKEKGAHVGLADDADGYAIAYHTLKRMELARDYPTAITHNVLAECGKIEKEDDPNYQASEADTIAQGEANMLEAVLLQRIVVPEDQKHTAMSVVPLFEEPDTMRKVEEIMKRTYENPYYQLHQKEVADKLHGGRITQQVQIAHSDNARRSGVVAARGYIHEAHKKLRRLNDAMGIETQFFEGGSISDAYRNGVRSLSAMVNAFELNDFAKFTFQGGDLLNFFNVPSSIERVFTRNFVEPATRASEKKKHYIAGTQSKGVLNWYEKRQQEIQQRSRKYMDAKSEAEASGKLEEFKKKSVSEVLEEKLTIDDYAIQAMKATLNDYQNNDFKKEKLGLLMDAMDYREETLAGNKGSRAAARTAPVFGKVGSTQVGAVLDPVGVDKLRTIPFSETPQQQGFLPSSVGAAKLLDYLNAHSQEIADCFGQKNNFGEIAQEGLSPMQIHRVYEKSPAFKDAMDKVGYGGALTTPYSFKRVQQYLSPNDPAQKRTMKYLDSNSVNAQYKREGKAYLDTIIDGFKKAGKLAYTALVGDNPTAGAESDSYGERIQSELATKALQKLTPDLERKSAYRDFVVHAREHVIDGYSKPENPTIDYDTYVACRNRLHNAGDTVYHGRILLADDPPYGELRYQQSQLAQSAAR